jgi:hypothetical protein
MDEIALIAWSQLAGPTRAAINRPYGDYCKRVRERLSRPVGRELWASWRTGAFRPTAAVFEPVEVNALVKAFEVRFDAVARFLARVNPVADLAGCPAWHKRKETLFILSLEHTDASGQLLVELTDDHIRALLERTFGGGGDGGGGGVGADDAPPSLPGLESLRAEALGVDDIQNAVDRTWRGWQVPATAGPSVVEELMDASVGEWDELWSRYVESRPWGGFINRLEAVGLSAADAPARPRVDGSGGRGTTPALDRTVTARVRHRMKRTGGSGRNWSTTTHPFFATTSTRQFIEREALRACEPLGLRRDDARAVLALAFHLTHFGITGSGLPGRRMRTLDRLVARERLLHSAYREAWLLPADLNRALVHLTPEVMHRLWTRAHGFDALDQPVEDAWGLLRSALISTLADLRKKVGAIAPTGGATNGPRKFDEASAVEGTTGTAVALKILCLLECAQDRARPAPVDVPAFVREVAADRTRAHRAEHEGVWTALTRWHQGVHRTAGHPKFDDLLDFLDEHRRDPGDEESDDA